MTRELIIKNGSLMMPVAIVKKSNIKVTSPFGMRVHPIKKTVHNHTGIDIVTPNKLAVIEYPDEYEITNDEINGLRLRASYKKAKIDLYIVHLATFLGYVAIVNDRKCLIVGMMGTSGSSTGPHYHIEVRLNGVLQDPTDTVVNLKFPIISL